MTDPIELIPLDAIDPVAILRDRTGYDAEPLEELKRSIASHGLRQPIEVFRLPEPRAGMTHGLISGSRHLAAFRAFLDAGDPAFAAIPAFVRPARDTAGTLAAMVKENAVRAEDSPWEQALVAVLACERAPSRRSTPPSTRSTRASTATAAAASAPSPRSSRSSTANSPRPRS